MKYQTIVNQNQKCHGQLYFGINDAELKKGFDDIPIEQGQQYRFGISFEVKETVKLLQ